MSWLPIDDVEPVDGGYRLDAMARVVLEQDGVALPLLAHHVGISPDVHPFERLAAVVDDGDGDRPASCTEALNGPTVDGTSCQGTRSAPIAVVHLHGRERRSTVTNERHLVGL